MNKTQKERIEHLKYLIKNFNLTIWDLDFELIDKRIEVKNLEASINSKKDLLANYEKELSEMEVK